MAKEQPSLKPLKEQYKCRTSQGGSELVCATGFSWHCYLFSRREPEPLE